jgi:Fic family protein
MLLPTIHQQYYSKFLESVGSDHKVQDWFVLPSSESVKLDFQYLMQVSSVYSSKIEGNSLDLNSYFNTKDLQSKVKSKEITEIQDLSAAYSFAQNNPLNLQNFLKAHAILSKSFLDKKNQGKIRTTPIGVFGSSGLIYMAVEPENVNAELEVLFQDILGIKKQKLTKLEAIFFAALIHLKIAQIHPFADGNGRIARLCEKWFLAECFGESLWGYQPEQYYWENRNEYYTRINLGLDYYNLDHSKSIQFAKLVFDAYLK